MQHQFTASQTVRIPVQQADLPSDLTLERYLACPQRIVEGLTEPGGVEVLSPESFRLSLKPIQFLSLRFVPVATLRVYLPAQGQLRLQSNECELLGAEGFNQHFQLSLNGLLNVHRQDKQLCLEGQAHLRVVVDLPPPFQLTPQAIIVTTGNALLKGILKTIQRRLKQQLLADYWRWVQQSQPLSSARP
jgi:hypothetical protein